MNKLEELKEEFENLGNWEGIFGRGSETQRIIWEWIEALIQKEGGEAIREFIEWFHNQRGYNQQTKDLLCRYLDSYLSQTKGSGLPKECPQDWKDRYNTLSNEWDKFDKSREQTKAGGMINKIDNLPVTRITSDLGQEELISKKAVKEIVNE